MSEATKTELPKEFSAVTKAVKKLKKLHAHNDERIKFLKRQNKELRKIDLWRAKEMDKQEFEIWRLKMFLKEAGYDPENLPQPKGLSFCGPAMDPFPISEAGPSCPQNEKTSLGPPSVSPFKYSGPTLKRKCSEFDQDEEFNPDPKRRALPLTKFMEANKYACEETYGQYSVDHQLEQDVLNAKGRMDKDEDGESADEVEQVEKEKPETPASLSKKYLVENNLPASRQLGRAWDEPAQKAKEPTPRRRAEDEQFERELEIAIKMSLEDLAQKKGKDGGEEEEEEAEETSSECEDEGEGDSAVEGEEGFGDEEGEEDFGDEEGEDFGDEEGEDFGDEEGKEDFGDEEGKEDFGDEEGEESFGDEGDEGYGDEGEEDYGDEGEEGYGDEEEGYGDEEEGYGDGGEEGYGDEEEGEDSSEEGCDDDEATSPADPFEYYSDDEGEVNGGRKLSREEVSALQLAIERSLRPASENGERVEKEAPALTPAQDLGAGEDDKEAPASVPSGHESREDGDAKAAVPPSRQNSPDIQHMAELLLELAGERAEEEGGEGKVPALNSTGHSSDEGEVEARGPLSKRGYSELELAIATSLESLRKGEEGGAEQSAPRARKHVSKGSDQEEEAPDLEPFEYHSGNEGGLDLKVWSLEDTEDDSELYAPPSGFSRAN
ncbi:hypothetical protein HOY82DRAFT_648022 [Tuber indicum]|nr:hypothetical protein HOY82DRAFT_648022 [Tuber indicum]